MVSTQREFSSNISLEDYNTMRIKANAKLFYSVRSADDILWVINTPEYKKYDVLWLGGGSNVLFTADFAGIVVHVCLKGMELGEISGNCKIVSASAGENWHDFVQWTLEHNLGGLENLSFIPGQVGAAPVQNIGAYGVELSDRFYKLEAINLSTGNTEVFDAEKCAFSYRSSYFKTTRKYVIIKVWFSLTVDDHRLVTSYGHVTDELSRNEAQPTISNVVMAVGNIRRRKLPDVTLLGNCGSFFKNPIVDEILVEKLKERFPRMPVYPNNGGLYKFSAGWLIETCGWKGYREGRAGIYPNHALVLVNYGGAEGSDILKLSRDIQQSVYNKLGILLETEVNIV